MSWLKKPTLVLVSLLALTVAACSTGTGEKSSGAGENSDIWNSGNGKISSKELRQHVLGSTNGKTIAWVPVGTGVPLTDEWTHVIKERSEGLGMKFVLRDPNWDSQRESQMVNSLIAQHPDVMVVHNPDVQLLANSIKQAQQAGIYVIQVNMVSNYKSDAYIGADMVALGARAATDIVNACGPGTSQKVQIIEGPKTSGASLDQLAGAKSVFDKHPDIKIVSDQSGGNWDPSAAHDLAQTVLKQHPDLCAIYGFWGVMTNGASQAVKEAGLTGKVKVFTSGGGAPIGCKNLSNGLFTEYINYNAPLQGQQVVDTANMLLQSGMKPGTLHLAMYSPLQIWAQDNMGTCYTPKKTLP